jgi:YVTN family beta-propeller protein
MRLSPLPILIGFIAALAAGAALATPPPPAYSVTASIPGPDGGWDLLGVDSAGRTLYVARSGGMMAVDLASGRVSPDLVKGTRGHAALPIPGTSLVLFTSGNDNAAYLYDTDAGRLAATIAVGKNPDAAAYDPLTRTVWVMNPSSGDISVIDPLAAKVIETIAVGGSLELAVADGKGRLYVNIEDRNEVVVLDTRARKIISHFPLKGCDGPTGIAYDAAAHQILSACANGVAIVSSPDGRQLASLAVGPRPDGALYDDRRHLAFVPSGGDGTLAVISLGDKPRVVTTVQTAKGARTAALDPASGRLYLPSAQYGAATGSGRPPMVPGSFAILVVSPSTAP